MRDGSSGVGGSSAFDFSAADDFWKGLADAAAPEKPAPVVAPAAARASVAPPADDDEVVMGRPREAAPAAPPARPVSRGRASDASGPQTGVGLERAVANVRRKSQGFVTDSFSRGRPIPLERAAPDPWARAQQRQWWAAGALLGVAAAVLGLFAMLDRSGPRAQPEAAPARTAIPAPAASAPEAAAAPATTLNTSTPGWRPMIPARVRSSVEPVTHTAEAPAGHAPAARKHHKPQPSHLHASR